MKNLKFIILFVLISVTCLGMTAQTGYKYLIRNTNERGIPTYLKFNTRTYQLTDPSEIFSEEFKIRDIDEFRKVKTTTRKLESGDVIKNEEYQQYYNVIKVEQGLYIIHYKNDIIYSLNGLYLNNINIDYIPKINNEVALSNALKLVNAETYYWDINDSIGIPDRELVIIESDTLESDYYLAYRFIICAMKPLSSDLIYVDANDGSILKKHSLIFNDIPNPGTAFTR